MPDTPQRLQRSRARGWRMPPGAIYVGRPTMWGNPFTVRAAIDIGYATPASAPRFVTDCFRDWLRGTPRGLGWWQGEQSDKRRSEIRAQLATLRGRDLVCWCPEHAACHADVLLELANAPLLCEAVR